MIKMKELQVNDILKKCGGVLINGNVNEILEDFSKDTRTIKKDDIYIGIKGENFDGNTLWKDALEKGAKGCIIQGIEFLEEDIANFKDKIIIKVDDTLEYLYKLAEYKRSLYDIPVIAITGSVGKTSTKDVIASVVGMKYKTLKTEGNNNNNIGLPMTILRLKDHEAAVLEMGMNHFGEINLLSKIAKPTLAVITNIGTAHIGILGSRENILKAKLEILDGMYEKNIVINNDNDLLHDWSTKNKECNVYTYGIENESDFIAKNIELEEFGSKFTYENNIIKVPVGGIHFIYNSLSAIAVGKYLGISSEKIKMGIEKFELTKKRMDIMEKRAAMIINDSYNASFESMKASLAYLASVSKSRKIAVLGDMFELGDYSKELHEKVGEEVVKNKIDILISCGENAKNIVEKAKSKGMNSNNIYYLKNIEEIVDLLKNILNSDDAVLIKASNGMKFYNIIDMI